jgi:hypothetical protein
LTNILPEYRWSTYEATFNDIEGGKSVAYDHAWIYGVARNGGRKLFVDLAHLARPEIFMEVEKNAYPDIPQYKNMVEVSRRTLNWRRMVEGQREYYTGKESSEIAKIIDGGIAMKILFLETTKSNTVDASIVI